jgi:hypothetical protein
MKGNSPLHNLRNGAAVHGGSGSARRLRKRQVRRARQATGRQPSGMHSSPSDEPGAGIWAVDVFACARVLTEAEPSLLFVHLGEADWAGHDHGWLSEEYWEAVAEADEAIGVLLQVLDTHLEAGEYTLIVTADHGGSGYTHGGSDPESLTIPWIAWGEGVRTGSRLTDPVRFGTRVPLPPACCGYATHLLLPVAAVQRPVGRGFVGLHFSYAIATVYDVGAPRHRTVSPLHSLAL